MDLVWNRTRSYTIFNAPVLKKHSIHKQIFPSRTLKTMRVFMAVVALVLCIVPAASQDRRVALVVGNSAYQHAPRLANPKNDAADMAAVLRRFGFQVIEGFDL